ncbi:MAG: hypothetical protein KGI54_18225, partial [Pseudomonadota bacterium]|nr:hypothetical protein [Pseudomonadota bacterium]
GSLTREDIHKIVRDVKELGCKWFLAERAESHRMPRGRILEDGPFEGYHCTDLTKWEFENE